MKFTFESKYATYENCEFSVGHYADNNNISLEIWSQYDGPIMRVTTNPGIKLPHDLIAIKNYSENEGIVDWLIRESIVEVNPVHEIYSGWVRIPIYRLSEHGKKMIGLID